MNREDEIVTKFAQEMLAKLELRHGRYTPMGWKTLDIKRLIWLLEGELRELKEAYDITAEGNALHAAVNSQERKDLIRDEAVDIANYAMFIYEVCQK